MTSRQRSVWEFCRYNGDVRTVDAAILGTSREKLSKTCRQLTARGVLEKKARGCWTRRPLEFLRRCVAPAADA